MLHEDGVKSGWVSLVSLLIQGQILLGPDQRGCWCLACSVGGIGTVAAGCGPKTWVPRAAVGLSRGTCLLRTRAVASRGIWARHADLETYQRLSLGTPGASLSLRIGQEEDSSLGKARALSLQGMTHRSLSHQISGRLLSPKA